MSALSDLKDAIQKATSFLADNVTKLSSDFVQKLTSAISDAKNLVEKYENDGVLSKIGDAADLVYQTGKIIALIAEGAAEIE